MMKNYEKLYPSSDRTIELNPSLDYVKLVIVISLVNAWCVWDSFSTWAVKSASLATILLLMIRLLRNPRPSPKYLKIIFQENHWWLCDRNGVLYRYYQLKIVFDSPFFMMIQWRNFQEKNKLVIFKDQITVSDYRLLKFTEKIQ